MLMMVTVIAVPRMMLAAALSTLWKGIHWLEASFEELQRREARLSPTHQSQSKTSGSSLTPSDASLAFLGREAHCRAALSQIPG
jgi:hypothetical protein